MSKKMLRFLVFFMGIFAILFYFPKVTQAEEIASNQKLDKVVVISNPKIPRPKNGLKMRIVFEEDLTIGVAEGDENYMFGGRVYFNVDDEDNFYVNDWDKRLIKKFDPQGKYLLSFGRRGQGPGEFQNVWVPRFDKDNNLYVSDYVSRRISFFNKGGKFLRQMKIPDGLRDVHINSKGFFIARQSTSIEEPSGYKNIIVLGLFDDKLDLITEIHRQTWELKHSSGTSGRDAKSRAQFLADLLGVDVFKPSVSYVLAKDDFLYFGYPEKYEIRVYSPDGKLARVIHREYDPIKVIKKHIEDFISYQENEFFRFVPTPEDIKKKAYQLIKYPKYIPAYQRFTLMENGWLVVIVDSIENEYTLMDVFDQEGKYIAQFKTTVPTGGLFFKNSKAYALATENDYKFVERYNFEIQEYKDGKWIRKK